MIDNININEVSPISFYKLYYSRYKIRIIDLRDTFDFEKYHIYTSSNIPYRLLTTKPFLFLNKQYHYYLICRDGHLSKDATRILTMHGYNVTNVIGGIRMWRGEFVSEEKYC